MIRALLEGLPLLLRPGLPAGEPGVDVPGRRVVRKRPGISGLKARDAAVRVPERVERGEVSLAQRAGVAGAELQRAYIRKCE
jgi:hypothetical protein